MRGKKTNRISKNRKKTIVFFYRKQLKWTHYKTAQLVGTSYQHAQKSFAISTGWKASDYFWRCLELFMHNSTIKARLGIKNAYEIPKHKNYESIKEKVFRSKTHQKDIAKAICTSGSYFSQVMHNKKEASTMFWRCIDFYFENLKLRQKQKQALNAKLA